MRADYILYYKPNIPLAVIDAKDNNCGVGDGIQQALGYAETRQIPFVFSSNGDGFVFHDRTATSGAIEQNLQLHEFPSPTTLWARYRAWKGLPPEAESVDRPPGLLRRRQFPVSLAARSRPVCLAIGGRDSPLSTGSRLGSRTKSSHQF